MKKKILFLMVLSLFLVPFKAFAISGSVSCSPGSKIVTVGETFTVTISGRADSSTDWAAADVVNVTGVLSLVGDGGRSFFQQDAGSFSKTYTIKANAVGSGSVNQLISYTTNPETGEDTSVWSSKCNITVVAANSSNSSNNNSSKTQASISNTTKKKPDPNKSSNNNLKSITIEGVELTPEFNKDTLEYSAIVEGNVEKIFVSAEAEDGKSSIEGLNERTLEEGLNEIILYVHAENGDTKEYKLNITRKEKNPIEVVIDGKKYTVVKKETEMELPDGFEKETIKIQEEDVVAYTNEKAGRTLVVLIDEEGNTGFYIYNSSKNTYTRYIEFKSKEIKLMITEPKEEIPFRYKKSTFTINGQKVNGYYYKSKAKFRLVYGVNMETGEEGFYQYDMEQKTFQRFYNDQVEEYTVYGKYIMYAGIGLVALLLLLFITTISLSIKNRKLKKKIKGEIKEEKKPQTREERLKLKEENAKKEEIPTKEEVDTKALKKEEKRLAKEAKLKEKEEKKLAKEKVVEEPIEEPKKEVSKEINDEDNLDTKAIKKIKKEEERKLKEEANEFLK